MRTMALDDPRRARLLRTLAHALDVWPDVAAARAAARSAHCGRRRRRSSHRIVATGHAHIDTAWLWPMRETVRKCIRTFASAVRLMDEYPEYRFACSQAQQYAWIEQAEPDLFGRIDVKVHGGQWIPVGGMWVEADMNLPSGESLARQIVHGQRYFESRFGRRCSEVWIPDVFGYPASMPQLYAAGGMRRFVTQKLSWNTHQPLSASHVLVGGARRHTGAHPLPTGRHLQRRGHAGRVRGVGRPLPRRAPGRTGR